MDRATIQRLNQINRDFYRQTAGDFDQTRQTPWRGWERLLPHLATPLSEITRMQRVLERDPSLEIVFGSRVQLLGRDLAVGDLDPEHLVVPPLALAVDPVGQAEDPEDVLVDRTVEVPGQHPLELVDVGRLGGVDRSLVHGEPSGSRGRHVVL